MEWEDDGGDGRASGVGQKNEDILRCVLVLDKEFRDRNVPFVRFPGIASAQVSQKRTRVNKIWQRSKYRDIVYHHFV